MKPRQQYLFNHQYFHEVTVRRQPEQVFDYVTDPNRWHEWFSAAKPARVDFDAQKAGESFDLSTSYRLFSFLPFHLIRDLRCRVSKSDRPYLWEVEADSPMVKAITSYTLSRVEEGTVLKRQFSYRFKGRYRYFEPWLFRRRVTAQAELSLQRVKQCLEREPR